jgi:hypothetical protein
VTRREILEVILGAGLGAVLVAEHFGASVIQPILSQIAVEIALLYLAGVALLDEMGVLPRTWR